MSDWKQVTLGDQLTRVRRKVAVEDGATYPAVSVQMYGRGLGEKEPFVGGVSKYAALNMVRENDVVLRTITAFEAPAGVARTEHDGTHVSGVFITYEVDQIVLPEFLRLFFQTPAFWDEMQNRASGTVLRRKTISDASFRDIPFALPPLPVQERIINILEAVDNQLTALEAEVDAVVKVRLGLIGRSADTEQVPLESLGVVSQGKGLPKESQGKQTGKISWYKIADMTRPQNMFGYTLADTRLTPSEMAEIGGVVVEAGAVTFPRVGAAILTEKKRIMDTPGALDENHLVITPDKATSSEYLLAVMESFALSSLVRPGAVPSLNMGLIRSTKVPWSWMENKSLGTVLGALRAESRVLAAEVASLRATRANLLSGLLDHTIDIESAKSEV
ncbi:restriction endonuclease subunit S [Rhodococcus erythropolis]|uniref:restriction endonuclease subunit S n=1 Tax=Rhodococcus erythropolis TaxID=1833 RepID=UPI001E2F57D5|nr:MULTISPECIES: restriction endonuclease subunit S [Rhodococcus erythropolis group]MCD2107456.1 restriction endonuclease subunit S [Rhodococcus qingshengii]MCZ4526849.1 restriction endonuclease subunit S [Rhodococcus erythropolis]